MATVAQHRRPQTTLDIWPGFVDALATLLMVIIFLLSIFVLAQFFLTEQLAGRDVALKRLETQVAELADMLALERQAGADLRVSLATLSAQLEASTAARDRLDAEARRLRGDLDAARAEIEAERGWAGTLSDELEGARARIAEDRDALERTQALSAARRDEVELLGRNIAALRAEIARLAAALDASEAKARKQEVQIANLGQRLNAALASRVEELSRYRSEFFGRLREVLGSRDDVRIVGDRFVFQSEVLFDTAAAALNPSGLAQIRRLAATLIELSRKIPPEIDWVLRVDGHTDARPIATAQFPSNWELSQARALSVVRALIAEGVPADRLAPTGFGQFQPIDPGYTPEAWQRNRRIEFKLTER